MNVDSIITRWHAGLVDLDSGVGVAVQAEPSCECAACLLELWEDRTDFDSELSALEVAPALLLPDEPGVLPRYVLATVRLDCDENDLQVPLWEQDGLPVAAGAHLGRDLEGALEGDLMAELWRRLEALVDELDGADA